jgi:hypothetical protein
MGRQNDFRRVSMPLHSRRPASTDDYDLPDPPEPTSSCAQGLSGGRAVATCPEPAAVASQAANA